MYLVKKVKVQYYASICIALFCIAVMVVTPIFVEGYMWPIMLFPLLIQLPLIVNGRRVLKEVGAI